MLWTFDTDFGDSRNRRENIYIRSSVEVSEIITKALKVLRGFNTVYVLNKAKAFIAELLVSNLKNKLE